MLCMGSALPIHSPDTNVDYSLVLFGHHCLEVVRGYTDFVSVSVLSGVRGKVKFLSYIIKGVDLAAHWRWCATCAIHKISIAFLAISGVHLWVYVSVKGGPLSLQAAAMLLTWTP
jgi:hypothetical protein